MKGDKESFRKMAVSQLDLEKSQIFQLLKVLGFSGRLHWMVNTEIRLIIPFAAKDGEALYS